MTARRGKPLARFISPDRRSVQSSSSSSGEEPLVKRPRVESCPGVAGIIRRVRLENFMCHASFECEPGPYINIVTGANGSGKSSILQAIALGLLADSKHTKRYKTLRDFIQRGASKAVIEVTLSNVGEDAWDQVRFKEAITFCRTIRLPDKNEFCLKNEVGLIIIGNTKIARDVGRQILEHFNIATANPMVILHQEEAKEFLLNVTPEKLYSFFIKATLLEQIWQNHITAETQLNLIKNQRKRSEEEKERVRGEIKTAQRAIEGLQEKFEKSKEFKRLEKEVKWARVHTLRGALKKNDEEQAAERDKQKLARENLEKHNKENSDMQAKLAQLKEEREKDREKFSKELLVLDRLAGELETIRSKKQQVEGQLRELRSLRNETEADLKRFESNLEHRTDQKEWKRRLECRESRARKLMQIDKDIEEARQKIHEVGVDLEEQLEDKETELKERLSKETKQLEKMEDKLKQEEEHLQLLTSNDNKSLRAFGIHADRVQQAIEKRREEFKIIPIGPVGSCISLKGLAASNERVGRLVESQISAPNLHSYLVDNHADLHVLQDILRREYEGRSLPRVVISRFLPHCHKVRPIRTPAEHPRLMDLIEVNNPVVFNYLVDQCSVEGVVVCPNQQAALAITSRLENVPDGLLYALSYEAGGSVFYRFHPATRNGGGMRSYYIRDLDRGTKLHADPSQGLAHQRHRITAGKLELKEQRLKIDKLTSEISDVENEQQERKNKMQKFRDLEVKLRQMKSKLMQEEQDDSCFDTQDIEKQIEKARSQLTGLEGDILQKEDELNSLQLDIEDKQREKKLKQEKYADLMEPSQLDNEISTKEALTMHFKRLIANQEKVLRNSGSVLKQKSTERTRLQAEFDKLYEDAMQSTENEELNPTDSLETLRGKLWLAKKNQLSDAEYKQFDQLGQQLRSLLEKREKVKKSLDDIVSNMSALLENHDRRKLTFLHVRTHVQSMVVRSFEHHSDQLSGQSMERISLEINSGDRKISIISDSEERLKDQELLASLSGGEKSLIQLCLFFALWGVTNPPFRALDEWDVYLDGMNRAKSYQLLRRAALQQQKQFFFISPQSGLDYRAGLKEAERRRVNVVEIGNAPSS